MYFQVNPAGEAVDLDVPRCPESDTNTRIDPSITGPCPTDHLHDEHHDNVWASAWSAESPVDYPDTQPVVVTARTPVSHTVGVLAAAAAIAAAVGVLATHHSAPAPVLAAPAPSVTTETERDTATVTITPTTTTTVSPTPGAYVAPFDAALITAAERRGFYDDLTARRVTTPHHTAYLDAVQGCLDLNVIRRSGYSVGTEELTHEESMMNTSRADAALIMGAAVREFPNCY